MGSEREVRGSGSVEVLPTSAVGETASSVLGGEEGRLLLVRRVSIVIVGGALRRGGHLTVDSQIVFKLINISTSGDSLLQEMNEMGLRGVLFILWLSGYY